MRLLEMMEKGLIDPAAMITHVGGLDAVIDTTLNLPNIPGGKKLIYTNIEMPLTAIADFESLGKKDAVFKDLADIVKKNKGLWSCEAEKISVRGEKMIAPALRMIMMGEEKSGILKRFDGGREGGGYRYHKSELLKAKGYKSVYVEDEGLIKFINNYSGKRLDQKISIVTGSARALAKASRRNDKNRAYVVIADLNYSLAKSVAEDFAGNTARAYP